jgi:hypothetical protein
MLLSMKKERKILAKHGGGTHTNTTIDVWVARHEMHDAKNSTRNDGCSLAGTTRKAGRVWAAIPRHSTGTNTTRKIR